MGMNYATADSRILKIPTAAQNDQNIMFYSWKNCSILANANMTQNVKDINENLYVSIYPIHLYETLTFIVGPYGHKQHPSVRKSKTYKPYHASKARKVG